MIGAKRLAPIFAKSRNIIGCLAPIAWRQFPPKSKNIIVLLAPISICLSDRLRVTRPAPPYALNCGGSDNQPRGKMSDEDVPQANERTNQRVSWKDFKVSKPVERQKVGHPDGVMEMRVDVACPHCKRFFDAAESAAGSGKAFACSQHMRSGSCISEDGEDGVDGRRNKAHPTIFVPAPYTSKRVGARALDNVHIRCHERITQLEVDVSNLRQEHQNRLQSLEADRDAVKGLLAAEHRVLRGQFVTIELPLTDSTGEMTLKRALLDHRSAEFAKQARVDDECQRVERVAMQKQLEAKCIENHVLQDQLRQYKEAFGPLPTTAPPTSSASTPLDHREAFAQLEDAQQQRECPDPNDFQSLSSDATHAFRNQVRRSGRVEAGDLGAIDD